MFNPLYIFNSNIFQFYKLYFNLSQTSLLILIFILLDSFLSFANMNALFDISLVLPSLQ